MSSYFGSSSSKDDYNNDGDDSFDDYDDISGVETSPTQETEEYDVDDDDVDDDDSYSQGDDDGDDEEDDEDDDDTSIRSLVFGAWKQHIVAILVAVLAAIFSFWLHTDEDIALKDVLSVVLQNRKNVSNAADMIPIALAPTLNQDYIQKKLQFASSSAVQNDDQKAKQKHQRHAHLQDYIRTANISFCNNNIGINNQKKMNSQEKTNGLEVMDFYLPLDYIDTMKHLYIADYLEDDFYENTHLYQGVDGSILRDKYPEYACLVQQIHALQQPRDLSTTLGESYRHVVKGTTYYYKTPKLQDMYRVDENDHQGATPSSTNGGGVMNTLKAYDSNILKRNKYDKTPPLTFTGFGIKFINLSTDPVLLFWDGKGGHSKSAKLVGEVLPMESIGTATMPGHSFSITPTYDIDHALKRYVVTADTALLYYEPLDVNEIENELMITIGDDDKTKSLMYFQYQLQKLNQAFARDYLVATQRTWLGQFPRRYPVHFMHPADYIGQRHITSSSNLELSLEVASVSPRVFTIANFMTPDECEQLKALAEEQGLHPSTLHTGGKPAAQATHDSNTRSSSTTWLSRQKSTLTDTIYRRAAQVLNIDSQLLQGVIEGEEEHHDDPRYNSIAESIQVVHYGKGGEEYHPHHDFVYPSVSHRYQPTRFATLLVYLNTMDDDETLGNNNNNAGYTRFPRSMNKDKAEGLEVQPKQGHAVLFYNILPDGNVDDVSQHGSNPTNKYQDKWMANIWVWDPVID